MKNLKNVIITVVALFFLYSCGSGSDEPTKLDAEIEVQYYVEDQLKAPSTAEFGLAEVTDNGDGTFFVSNYVDSENGFGAKIRMNYSCTIEFTANDKFKIHDFMTF
jgi:hypothetical protein